MRSSHLFGVTAAGLFLWCVSVAKAQSMAPSHVNQTGLPTRVRASSDSATSMICDGSGNICIPINSATQVRGQLSPSLLHGTTHSVPADSPAVSDVSAQSNQSRSPKVIDTRLICDSSGKVCAPAQPPSMVMGLHATTSVKAPVSEASKATDGAQYPSAKASGLSPINRTSSAQEPRPINTANEDVSDDPLDWSVHAYKSRHRLEVYYKGHLYKTYHAVFGRNPFGGAKLWEGDRRTPEGNYLIVGKHRSLRFGWFLHLNYPNERDRERFEQSRAAHLIPASAHEGGEIGIHGTDSPYLNVAEVDWTTGCISVDNAAISELAHLLPIGTLVVINP